MEGILLYLLKFSIVIALLSVFYFLLLRKETFYHLNRYYLLGALIVSAILPAVDLTALSDNTFESTAILQGIPAISDISFRSAKPSYSESIQLIVLVVWLTGVLILLFRLIIQYASLFRLLGKAVLVQEDDRMKVFNIQDGAVPFSFGSGVYVPVAKYSEDELQKILKHESVHVRGNHSVDILLSELLCIFNWFNPFAWTLRKFIRQNLEFIADDAVLSATSDGKAYQYLLLKSSTGSFSMPVTTFSAQNLKKRIVMMNTSKSSRSRLLKFVATVPVLFFVSLLFRDAAIVAQVVGPITGRSDAGVVIRLDSSKGKPLFIVDNWRQAPGFDTKMIKPEDITSVTVWKGAEAVKQFGDEAAKEGVISLTTKLPLYVIDGVVQMKTSNARNLINDNDIASMNVLKGEADKDKYGIRSENGIIEITKKKK